MQAGHGLLFPSARDVLRTVRGGIHGIGVSVKCKLDVSVSGTEFAVLSMRRANLNE